MTKFMQILTCAFEPELVLGEPEYFGESGSHHSMLLVCYVGVLQLSCVKILNPNSNFAYIGRTALKFSKSNMLCSVYRFHTLLLNKQLIVAK